MGHQKVISKVHMGNFDGSKPIDWDKLQEKNIFSVDVPLKRAQISIYSGGELAKVLAEFFI